MINKLTVKWGRVSNDTRRNKGIELVKIRLQVLCGRLYKTHLHCNGFSLLSPANLYGIILNSKLYVCIRRNGSLYSSDYRSIQYWLWNRSTNKVECSIGGKRQFKWIESNSQLMNKIQMNSRGTLLIQIKSRCSQNLALLVVNAICSYATQFCSLRIEFSIH